MSARIRSATEFLGDAILAVRQRYQYENIAVGHGGRNAPNENFIKVDTHKISDSAALVSSP